MSQENIVQFNEAVVFGLSHPFSPYYLVKEKFAVDPDSIQQYSSVMQYIQHAKATVYDADCIADVLGATLAIAEETESAVAQLGSLRRRLDEKMAQASQKIIGDSWTPSRRPFAFVAYLRFFEAHPAFLKELLATNNKTLFLASSGMDSHWGVSQSVKDVALRKSKGDVFEETWLGGANYAGKVLMQVRDHFAKLQALLKA